MTSKGPSVRCGCYGASADSRSDARKTDCSQEYVDNRYLFRSWHIRSYTGFVSSLIAIVLLGIFFEWLRSYAKGVDREILAKETKGRARLGSSRDGSRERGEEVPRYVFLARIS